MWLSVLIIQFASYRDGLDGISWHSDKTQGEETIVSLVTESEGSPRTVCIQPSNRYAIRAGGEQVELFPDAGDGYIMDGKHCMLRHVRLAAVVAHCLARTNIRSILAGEMQQNYVHSILKLSPKAKAGTAGRRMAIVFRHGLERYIPQDTGSNVQSTEAPDRSPLEYKFGHLDGVKEGVLYSRQELVENGAHQLDRRGVSGNSTVGCNSIIVSKGHPAALMGTHDSYRYLSYCATNIQGALALSQSMTLRLPIRVFRCSKGWLVDQPLSASINQIYRQSYSLKFAPKCVGIKYRYDGLYYITGMEEDAIGGTIHPVSRFRLLRAEPIQQRDNFHTLLQLHMGRELNVTERIPPGSAVSKKGASHIVGRAVGDFDLEEYTRLVNPTQIVC